MYPQLLSSFLLLTLATAQGFSGYPPAALPCLQTANANSGCNSETNNDLFNNCVCSNGGNSITNFAICLTNSDPADVVAAYNVYSANCESTYTPMTVSLAQFIAAGKQGGNNQASSVPAAQLSPSEASTAVANAPTATGSSNSGGSGAGNDGTSSGTLSSHSSGGVQHGLSSSFVLGIVIPAMAALAGTI